MYTKFLALILNNVNRKNQHYKYQSYQQKFMYDMKKITIINRQPSQKIKHVHPRNYTPTNNSKTPNPRKLALKNSNDSTVGKVAA